MSTMRSFANRAFFLIAAFGIADGSLRAGPFRLVSGSEQLTAVSSRVFSGYVREKNPDGSYRAETYAFGNGGELTSVQAGPGPSGGGAVSDPTIDDMGFPVLLQTIARPLAEQQFVPTRDANGTNLLIMVYWGRSGGTYNVQDGNLKDYIDALNAQLMGFDSERVFRDRTDASTVFFGRSIRASIMDNLHSDLISAIEMDRYYVILRALDFQAAWKHKKIKLLWETRFSLSERQHDFAKELPTMAHTASRYFGQDTQGLIRARIPEGQVDIGEIKSLGNVPEN
jgi:hypothetical protein